MNFNQYLNESAKTEKDIPGYNIVHHLLGMAGEYFSEVFTEDMIDNPEGLVEELGDFMWYFAGYCRCRDIEISTLITKPGVFGDFTPQCIGAILLSLEIHKLFNF